MRIKFTCCVMALVLTMLSACGGNVPENSTPAESFPTTDSTINTSTTMGTTVNSTTETFESSHPSGNTSAATTTTTVKPTETKTTKETTKKTTTTTVNTDTTYYGVENTDFKALAPKSHLNVGNTSRLTALFKKAASGKKIIIGAIGGSITAGEDKTLEGQYIQRIGQWFRDTFGCEVEVVNAGIGATTSFYGLHRAQKDLLQYKPDFVIVEYAVNDGGTQLDNNCYEMLVRDILNAESKPAVLLLCTMAQDGKNVQEYHVGCGEFYGLPVVSYRDAVWPEMEYGRIKWEELSPDNVHPNKTGHGILSLFVTELLQKIYKKQVTIDDSTYSIPKDTYYKKVYNEEPIPFKNARIITAEEMTIVKQGNVTLDELNFYPVWHLRKGGKLAIQFTGIRTVAIRYAYWNNGKMGYGTIALNNGLEEVVDGHFTNYLPNNGTFSPLLLSSNLDVKKQNKIIVEYLDMEGAYASTTTGESFMIVDLLVSE